ncbi:hypothetical protein VNO77_12356 [Canavalia gladiata]|uniref:Gnk2-homologous domain-containing protein n=1 Tax=Canavalia gladiata TaxID=3824 RepID=A0AAN9LWR2_CANGL
MVVISPRLPSFFCCVLFVITIVSQVEGGDVNAQDFHYFCDSNNDRGNYTTNSLYQSNLNRALNIITYRLESTNGFNATSIGANTNKVNVMGQCRGDVTPKECRECLKESKENLTQLCPNRKEAIGWYENEKCMLRYSDRSILGLNEIGPAYFVWNLHDAPKAEQFNQAVKKLLDSLRTMAASGDSRRKYAASTATGPDDQVIYGLAQCTPDLSESQCDNCLVQSIAELPLCCDNRIGTRIIRPSCYVRYETAYPFYGPPVPAP